MKSIFRRGILVVKIKISSWSLVQYLQHLPGVASGVVKTWIRTYKDIYSKSTFHNRDFSIKP